MSRKWRALAWDDNPAEYIDKLKPRLERSGQVELIVTQQADECYDRFQHDGPWDFVILDVIDNTSDPENPDRTAGSRLAAHLRRSRSDIPIIFLTHDDDIILSDFIVVGEPRLVKPKGTPIGNLVNDIISFVRSELEPFDRTKVFLIYGHGREAPGLLGKVRKALEERQVEVVEISPETVMRTISEALVRNMGQCGAFVALCTPDDKTAEDWYQPRQNVLLEIGLALGLPRGFARLVILQRWGEVPQHKAQLPSDLGGVLTIRFFEEQDEAITSLIRSLEARGMLLQK